MSAVIVLQPSRGRRRPGLPIDKQCAVPDDSAIGGRGSRTFPRSISFCVGPSPVCWSRVWQLHQSSGLRKRAVVHMLVHTEYIDTACVHLSTSYSGSLLPVPPPGMQLISAWFGCRPGTIGGTRPESGLCKNRSIRPLGRIWPLYVRLVCPVVIARSISDCCGQAVENGNNG